MHGIVAQWVHYEPALRINKALFVPYALGCPMPATPPWQTLGLMNLSWWKREVEEMIKR